MPRLGHTTRIIFATFLVVTGGLVAGFMPVPHDEPLTTLKWNARRKLTWDDFKGTANASTSMRAETHSRINYTYVCRYGNMEAQVTAEFVPEKSWVKNDPSENLLRHEQGHFDITEVYARKLRRHFEQAHNLCGKGQSAVDAEAKKIFSEWDATQDRYDEETNHSKNIPIQREWESRISNELKEMEMWATE